MVRKSNQQAVSLSAIDEIVALGLSEKPGQKKWFTRKMKELSEDEQNEVWDKLEAQGRTRPDAPKKDAADDNGNKGRVVITWSEEEWDRLAQAVWRCRKNDPAATLVGLVRKAISGFPVERRRNIRVVNELKPLLERLTKLDEEYLEATEQAERLQQRVDQMREAQSKEQILADLSDDEVVDRFSNRVLSHLAPDDILKNYPPEALIEYIPLPDLVGYCVKTGLEMFTENQAMLTDTLQQLTDVVRRSPQATPSRPTMPMPRPTPMPMPGTTKLPRVTVVGLLPEQQNKVESKLRGRANFNFVDKNRKADAIPDNQDFVVLAANFINHAVQEQAKKKASGTACRIIIHHGGIQTMVKKLQAVLPEPASVS